MANGKGHFGPTDRNDQTGHSGPPSKLVPNIPVGPNRNGPFHLMYQPKLPEFWVEWKALLVIPGRIQMTRFTPMEIFQKKRNTFRGITFFPFLQKHPKFFVPFVWLTSARLGTTWREKGKKYRRGRKTNCWFSHDVTKIQTKKPSILLRFYFHGVLEQLKTNLKTKFRFKRVLGFVIECVCQFLSFCVTQHLHDGRESGHLG